jgi:hypothetical protein
VVALADAAMSLKSMLFLWCGAVAALVTLSAFATAYYGSGFASPTHPAKNPPAAVANQPELPNGALDDRETLLRNEIAPKVMKLLEEMGGKAKLREALFDKQREIATIRCEFIATSIPVLDKQNANVEITYEIPTSTYRVYTDLYHGKLTRIDPNRPIVLWKSVELNMEWNLELKELKKIEHCFEPLKKSGNGSDKQLLKGDR